MLASKSSVVALISAGLDEVGSCGCAAALLLASCLATSLIASALPSSPSGLFALSPAVGSLVARWTGTAGYLPLVVVVLTRVCWSKCLHSPGL